jgi:hypothetical protein
VEHHVKNIVSKVNEKKNNNNESAKLRKNRKVFDNHNAAVA